MSTVTRIRLGYNNIYVHEGAGGRIAIDAGPDYEGAWGTIVASVAELPPTVLATHGHLDHAGLARRWQAAGSRVLLSEADTPLAAGPPLLTEAEAEPFERYVRAIGAPAEVEAEAIAGLWERRTWALKATRSSGYPPAGRGGRWPTGLRYEPFEPDELVAGNVTIGSLAVVSCPGHTPGNLVAVDEGEGWLFSGDQLLPDITPTPAIQFVGSQRFASLPAFIDSLRGLRGRAGRCFPGHGEPFDGVDAAIDGEIEAVEERSARVLGALGEGPGSTWAVAERIYPRAARRRFWQVVATVQGQLDLLAADGRVTATGDGYERL
ncbi:MAG: MBL fold metallo-hydrolase [Dehalococcoidia bacterium]